MSNIFEGKQKNKTIFKKSLFGQESGYIKEVLDILRSQTKIESEFAGPFLQTMPLKQLKEAGITVKKGKLKWSDDYESLHSFIESTFKLKGKWPSPGEHLKSFKNASESVIIRYYTNSTSFSFGRNVAILSGVLLNANIFQIIHRMETEIASFERGELPLSNQFLFHHKFG